MDDDEEEEDDDNDGDNDGKAGPNLRLTWKSGSEQATRKSKIKIAPFPKKKETPASEM